jgi:lipopolysaccharide export system protein LptA
MMKNTNNKITKIKQAIWLIGFAAFLGNPLISFAQDKAPVKPKEVEVSALKNHDTTQFIDISADRSEVHQKENTAKLIGNVIATQGDLTFKADEVLAYYEGVEGSSRRDLSRLDAKGHVILTSPTETASGEWGIYDVKNRLITLGGKVVLKRGSTVIEADRMEMDLISGITKFEGVKGSDKGRVKARFTAPEKKKN